jgi:hypothetical protein
MFRNRMGEGKENEKKVFLWFEIIRNETGKYWKIKLLR